MEVSAHVCLACEIGVDLQGVHAMLIDSHLSSLSLSLLCKNDNLNYQGNKGAIAQASAIIRTRGIVPIRGIIRTREIYQ